MGASRLPDPSPSPSPSPAPEDASDCSASRGGSEQDARLGCEEVRSEETEEVSDICGSTWEVSLFDRQSPEGSSDGLYVYHNTFHLLPSGIGRQRRLKTLKFFANEIEVLPPEVGDLVELERLQVKVSAPGIAGLPFRKLKSLSELELCQVPPRLSALSILSDISGLKCLTKLSISHFCIRYLPPEICNLKKLQDLDLSFNKLKNLPDDIAELGSLKSLKVANNKLIELPSSISSMGCLEKLDLSNNRLTSLTSLRLASMFTLQHLNLQYNKLPYGCHQIPPWIRCNFEGNVEGNTKVENCKSFAAVDTHDTTVHRTHWNHSCHGFHCGSSCSHSDAPSNSRCHAIKRMNRLAWKRHSCLQQRVRQERLNHSRNWKDNNNDMNIKMVEEDGSSALLEQENRQLQTAAKKERILDDSGKLNSLHDDFAVVDDECCLSKDATVLLKHDSAEMNKVGSDKNIFEQSSCTTSDSVILNKDEEIQSETEDNCSLLHTITVIDAPDEHSSCESSKFISKTKRHSDKDLDNPKPRKFRKPVEDFSNLSCKYSIQSLCSIDDYIPDGFYDAGRDRPFKPLQEFEQELSLDSREIILLDRDKDEELDAIVFSAQLLMSSLQRSSITGTEENVVDNLHRASVLALFVSDCFGGSDRSTLVLRMRQSILGLQNQQPFVCTCPIRNIFENNEMLRRMYSHVTDLNINNLCEKSLQLIKESQNSNVVPIGTLRFGICRHRAVLMKYLCDRMDPPIPCELVRGYIDFTPHAWNVICVRRGNSWLRMIVDACYPTDIREEADSEYFCRYIPLSRLHVPVRTENPTIAEWALPSSLHNHVTQNKATNSVFLYKVGTVDTAVKVRCLEVDHTSNEEIRNFEYKFLGEVRILGALRNHRCIVNIYGHQLLCKWVPRTDGKNEHRRLLQSMIIMEYVNGGSLKNYIVGLRKEGQKHVPVDDALCIARDVACALVEVHAKQIIHRDIKSENILVDFKTRSGGRPVVKLSDFDRSVPLNCYAHTCCIAHHGIHPPDVCVGTPRWMAPEVVKAMHQRNQYGLEVDIWSYGCLLLELLTLQVPYQGQSESEYYSLLQMKQRPRLTPELEALASSDEGTIRSNQSEFSDADVKILKVLVDLFYRCTSRNPSDRPSARDIYDSLSVISPRLQKDHASQQSD